MEQYVLHVTHRCNLRCKYCYERVRDITYTQEEIRGTCDQIAKCKEPCHVEFIGGEPLLAFDHIQFAYGYLKEHAPQVLDFTISTNLTILSEAMITWLKKRDDVRLSISLDGSKWANQFRTTATGVNSYELVVKNLRRAIREFPEDRVAVHMVAHHYNVGILSGSIDHLYGLGVRHIGVGIIESTMRIDREFADRYLVEMNIVSKKRANGDYPGLHVSEQDGIKPVEDKRTYVYDDHGKMIFESYGRASEDAITAGDVKTEVPGSPVSGLINNIRARTFENHQARMHADQMGKKNEWEKVIHPAMTLRNLEPMVAKHDLKLKVEQKAPHAYIVDLESPWKNLAQGKGTSELSATCSCLAEFAERCALPPGWNSNGAAAGNTRDEAILQAVSEIFERYAMYNSGINDKVLYPTVRPLSIEDEVICELYFWFLKQDYKLYIKQLSDLIPTYGVYWVNTRKPENDYTRYSYTVGTAWDSNVAIKRALLEKFQLQLHSDWIYLRPDSAVIDLLQNGRSLWDTTHLMKGPEVEYTPTRSEYLSRDVAEVKAILAMKGAGIKVTDHESEWMPVVSVRIEGMMNMFGEEGKYVDDQS